MPLVYLGEFQEVVVDRTKTTCGQQEAVHDLFGGGGFQDWETLRPFADRYQSIKSSAWLDLETGLRGLVGAGFRPQIRNSP
jgi:hypothetical protein